MGKGPRKHRKEMNSTIQLGPFVLLLAIKQAHVAGARLMTEMCFLYEFLIFSTIFHLYVFWADLEIGYK